MKTQSTSLPVAPGGSGGYTVNDETVTFGLIALTKKACVGELQANLERVVLQTISSGEPVSLEINSNHLTLEAGGIGVRLAAETL